MDVLKEKILDSYKKFKLDIRDRKVLTEAATGNYVVTPVIAALGGADVIAFTRDSVYGSGDEVKSQTYALAEKFALSDKINVATDLKEIDLKKVDILTNTGFLRPINRELISRLSPKCVIPLMWEPWEYRREELDLDACLEYGIKVYGTNENYERIRTMDYIGYTVLKLLLDNMLSPFSANVLLVGCEKFVSPVSKILKKNDYRVTGITDYSKKVDVSDYSAIILLEHQRDIKIIGESGSFILSDEISDNTLVIHICGNVCFSNSTYKYIPKKPAKFGYMSYTTDYIDSQAVIDLHTAGLKVAEGMLAANECGLKGEEYKDFMESKYPALAFDDVKYW